MAVETTHERPQDLDLDLTAPSLAEGPEAPAQTSAPGPLAGAGASLAAGDPRGLGSEHMLALQRTAGNGAVAQLIQRSPRPVERSAGSRLIQRKLPSHLDIFSLDSFADRHNALIERVNTEVGPPVSRCGELAELLKGFNVTAQIDADIMKDAAKQIESESSKPGEQAVEAATEDYLKAYEAFDIAPTPDVETAAMDGAVSGLEAKLAAAEKVEADDEHGKDEAAVAAERKSIDAIAKSVGAGVELALKTVKAAATGEGWADVGISIAKEGSTRLTEWMLSNSDGMKALEAKLEDSKTRLQGIKTVEAANEVKSAQAALKAATDALNRKMREIGGVVKELERAERDLTIEMRALGLEDAAGAVETRAAARRTATEMLVALDECRAAIDGVLPEATEVYNSFDSLDATRGDIVPEAGLSALQEMELDSFIRQGKRTKPVLERQLEQIEQNRGLIQGGHFDRIYKPVHEILHQTQA